MIATFIVLLVNCFYSCMHYHTHICIGIHTHTHRIYAHALLHTHTRTHITLSDIPLYSRTYKTGKLHILQCGPEDEKHAHLSVKTYLHKLNVNI